MAFLIIFHLLNYISPLIPKLYGKMKQKLAYYEVESTQPARDVPGTSQEGPRKVLTSETYRGPVGDSKGTNKEIDNLIKKCFLDAIVLVLHICYCFLLEKQIYKSFKRGRPRDVYGTKLRDVLGTRSWELSFLSSTQKHIQLTLTGYSRLYSEL